MSFAITIKSVYYPGQDKALSMVFFLYVMGAVMANRLAGLYGESEKATVYGVLLVLVMALFALTFTSRYGAIFGGEDVGGGLWVNVCIIAVIGFASFKLCRESCFDIKEAKPEKTRRQHRAESQARQDWYRRELEEEQAAEREPAEEKEESPAEFPERPPGMWILFFSLFSMIVFAVGQRLLPESDGTFYIRAFNRLLANLVCALALLLLTTLSAVRFRCWEKKAQVPSEVGWFWILTGGAAILFVLSLASLPPRPTPPYLVQSAVSEESAPGGETQETEKSRSAETWGGTSKKIAMQFEKEERDKSHVSKDMQDSLKKDMQGGSSTEKQADEKPAEGAGSDAKATQKDPGGSGSEGRRSEGRGDSSKGNSSARSTQAAGSFGQSGFRPPAPTPPLHGLESLGRILLVLVIAICAVVAIIKIVGFVAGARVVSRMRNTLKRLGNRLRNLLKPRRRTGLSKRKLRAVLKQANLYMENPFANAGLLKRMSKAELVRYTYRAFENYAYIHGFIPGVGQTPREFVHALPLDFQPPEASTLLKLFMLAEYSNHGIPDDDLRKLRSVWAKMEA